MSGFLFLLVIDWIMRRTTEQGDTGIPWKMMRQLKDLDYADMDASANEIGKTVKK